VIFDPTINIFKGFPLSGYYAFDDEGVRSQKVVTVENGIFKNFLMSRSPIENFTNSNGHGRKNPGYDAVSRQSNLIVSAKETVSASTLKDKLREECKKQEKEYGLYFEKVQGGFTFTGTTVPNSFNVTPILVYKIYADGRADEMVRGVDLIGTPLTTFANIIAAGDDLGVFNGMCGAESGYIPVSACSPSLLVSLIEVQRKSKSQAKPPVLAAPVGKKGD
jgi:predicted Zn-dependent protease